MVEWYQWDRGTFGKRYIRVSDELAEHQSLSEVWSKTPGKLAFYDEDNELSYVTQ